MPPKKTRVPKPNPIFRGDRLQMIRGLMGLSQEELDKQLNFSPGQTGRYERNESEPLPDQLVKIARGTGVSIDWLLGVVDDPEGFNRPPDKNRLQSDELLLIHQYRAGEFLEMIRNLSTEALAKRQKTSSDTEDNKSK